MIFDRRSNSMLKYEKSKSKLVEFNVAKENYPNYPLDSKDLTYTALYVLSLYCEKLIDDPTSTALLALKAELNIVSRYYDVTVKTLTRREYSNQFLLLGSVTYFLSDNFGSAKVLIEQIKNWDMKNDIMTILYVVLKFLLTRIFIKYSDLREDYSKILADLREHFERGKSFDFSTLMNIRKEIYSDDDVFNVNYIDFLASIIVYAIKHSAWILLPKYSNSNIDTWKNFLYNSESIKLLWPAQKIIVEAGALKGKNLVIPLPTGVGKTKSIELLLRAKFMSQENNLAIVIAPLRALCNEITYDLTSALANEVIVNQFTDTAQEDYDLTMESDLKYVFICTPEKFSYILRHDQCIINKIQLFIFDEAHLFDDTSRGAQYEFLVSEISKSKNSGAQLVLFSAVLANANQISSWLFDDDSAIINSSLVKSTDKSIGFISSDKRIHYYEKDNMADESFFVPKSITVEHLRLQNNERKLKYFPENNAQDFAIYYANKLCEQGSTAIYAGRVTSIHRIMSRIVEISQRGYDLSNFLKGRNRKEISKLYNLFVRNYGNSFDCTKASRLGVFPHYADLANGIKMSIEYALRKNYISSVVCTTTLAEGVNIPIKYLFITTFRLGTTNIQIRKIQNMVGRTARAGIHTEGSAIITDSSFYDNRNDYKRGGKYKWNDCKKMFDYGYTEACISSILALVQDLYFNHSFFISSERLVSYILTNYGDKLCFENLISMMQKEYRNEFNGKKKNNTYMIDIKGKVMELKSIIENVESYMCYIYSPEQEAEHFYEVAVELIQKTFAYYLASEREKLALSEVIKLIAQKVVSKVDRDRVPYFAKSFYGIDISLKILQWVDENIKYIEEATFDDLLASFANLFGELFPDKTKVETNLLLKILRLWIASVSYEEMEHKIEKLKLSEIEKICAQTISFHLCFLIGNVIDALNNHSDSLIEKLSLLQKYVKYGVSSQFQVLICENLFDDRIIAKQLDELFGGNYRVNIDFREYIHRRYHDILNYLKDFPAFFSYKLNLYVQIN